MWLVLQSVRGRQLPWQWAQRYSDDWRAAPSEDQLEQFLTKLNHGHRPAGDRFTAGRFRSGAVLLGGHDASASLPSRASSRTEITTVPMIRPDWKPL